MTKLAALVEDATNGSRIPREPGVFKLETNMIGTFVVDTDDLAVICYWIDNSECLEDELVSMYCDWPRADEINVDTRPWVACNFSSWKLAVVTVLNFALLASAACSDCCFAIIL